MLQVDFYFDMSSPYSYFAAIKADEFAAKHNIQFNWLPFLLGAVFKDEGNMPLLDYPKKGAYSKIDFDRTAQLNGIEFSLPDVFPIAALPCKRAFYAIDEKYGPKKAADFAKAVMWGYFNKNKLLNEPETALFWGESLGVNKAWLEKAMNDDSYRHKLRQVTGNAIEKGVFGAPYFILDGEPFWGFDRMEQLAYRIRQKQG